MLYFALDILEPRQDFQAKAISLASVVVPPIHVVAKGQDQAYDLLYTVTFQQLLEWKGKQSVKKQGGQQMQLLKVLFIYESRRFS